MHLLMMGVGGEIFRGMRGNARHLMLQVVGKEEVMLEKAARGERCRADCRGMEGREGPATKHECSDL